MSSSTIVTTVERETRRVNGTDVTVFEVVWKDGGRSFEVETFGGIDLTEGNSFDAMPTDEQIAAILPAAWTCRCGRVFSENDADLIVDHVSECDA